jgi:hypothetical protein
MSSTQVYLHKNVNNPDKNECEVLGEPAEVRNVKDTYQTFIALPIRAGKLCNISDEFVTRPI